VQPRRRDVASTGRGCRSGLFAGALRSPRGRAARDSASLPAPATSWLAQQAAARSPLEPRRPAASRGTRLLRTPDPRPPRAVCGRASQGDVARCSSSIGSRSAPLAACAARGGGSDRAARAPGGRRRDSPPWRNARPATSSRVRAPRGRRPRRSHGGDHPGATTRGGGTSRAQLERNVARETGGELRAREVADPRVQPGLAAGARSAPTSVATAKEKLGLFRMIHCGVDYGDVESMRTSCIRSGTPSWHDRDRRRRRPRRRTR